MMHAAEGCDIPYLSFDMDVSEKSADARGQMNSNELNKFRTTWCCKRYDHDAKLCRFAQHANANKNIGWLRRDPANHDYRDRLCEFITTITNDDSIYKGCFVNTCKRGQLCEFAHPQEEIDYHPLRYKNRKCTSKTQQRNLLAICPRIRIIIIPTAGGAIQFRLQMERCSRD
jgi:hypothetical protein